MKVLIWIVDDSEIVEKEIPSLTIMEGKLGKVA